MSDDKLLDSLGQRFPIASERAFNVLDYVHAKGSPLEAWMYSRLFWPRFVEIDGMVFLRESLEDEEDADRVRKAVLTFEGDRREIQCSFNTFEVAEFFGPRRGDTTTEQDAYLAEVLAEMWRAKLQSDYPHRTCHVGVEPENESAGVAVSFYVE